MLGGDGGGKKDKKGDDDGGDDHDMEASGKLSFTVGDITYNLLPVLCCIALLCLLKVGKWKKNSLAQESEFAFAFESHEQKDCP